MNISRLQSHPTSSVGRYGFPGQFGGAREDELRPLAGRLRTSHTLWRAAGGWCRGDWMSWGFKMVPSGGTEELATSEKLKLDEVM